MVDEAILLYKKILDKNSFNFVVHFKLAEIYLNSGEIDKAVIHLEDILKINKFNYEVEKITVQKKLVEAYLTRQEIEKVFEVYVDILKLFPGDNEALYYVCFIALSNEHFEFVQQYFERLAGMEKNNFEILFGAGISSFQNQKTNESIQFFKEALSIEPYSDITNLAMAFSQQRKRAFKTALNYTKMIIDNSKDQTASFIAKRLHAILLVQAKKEREGLKVFQELLEYVKKKDMSDEMSVALYDIGFAALKAEMTDEAYEYWNQLYQHDRNF